ncbi:hypothetical protein N7520_009120 [Penicillium odoratum]|uniref:uncharacterized protein n=1 Tax=Penicillium odoratum TaxID=1167516 RepID=UPI002547DE8C|nr:uncharacterized protein N7520_009120 [Penicillium odoratum]KAJ5752203.1 hypothetical protein N7520_009120 [Penicillium odoratum]
MSEPHLRKVTKIKTPHNLPTDPGSVKSLINGGTDSFTEKFGHPPRDDRIRGLVYQNQTSMRDEERETILQHVGSNNPTYPLTCIDASIADVDIFHDTWLDFFNVPFDSEHKFVEYFNNGGAAPHSHLAEADSDLSVSWGDTILEPDPPFVMGLIQSILAQGWIVLKDAKAQQDFSTNLKFLLTAARTRKFIALYFKYWHPGCAIVHAPTFKPETVSVPLLASIVSMGAMYSSDQKEVHVAKRVLDFVELYIFSNDVFSPESGIEAIFCGNRLCEDEVDDWVKFQNFQAGLLITIVQYWAGNLVSRDRAMETRLNEVVKVARRKGIVKSRHRPADSELENLWIQKESHIRTMAIVSLLDSAFFFYQNYPCRLTPSEMEFELPCEESVFQAEHPFAAPRFQASRDITAFEAFQGLFDEDRGSPDNSNMHLTTLDMFILIHLLYVFINMQMSSWDPFLHQSPCNQNSQGRKSNSSRKRTSKDLALDSIRKALTRWHDRWFTLCDQIPKDEWDSFGFYKNGYNFWLVSQLLITRNDAADVIMQMRVKCDDKLEELNVLLPDEED